jgi:outer membrane scaffolding protein for murein synthesis (MipA/OmpV family)
MSASGAHAWHLQVDVSQWSYTTGATAAVSKTAANHAAYTMDARPATTYGFANFDQTGSSGNDGILMIRDPVPANATAGTLGNIEW